MITTLLVGTLAVTWAWEALRVLDSMLPWSLPKFLWPLVVLGLALVVTWPGWLLAAGIAGGAGVIHALVLGRGSEEPVPVQIKRGVGGRLPPLP